MSKFCQEIKDAGEIGEKFLRYIATAKDITLFAPSNSAWDDGNLKNIVRRGNDFEELLKLHVVPNKVLFMDDILRNNQDHVRIKKLTLFCVERKHFFKGISCTYEYCTQRFVFQCGLW